MTRSSSPLSYEYALLGFLSNRPMHAYEIHRRLRKASGLRLIWTVKQGQLYALLARLEDEGYIVSTLEPQDGRPPRKMLSLTAAGEAAFARWMVEPVRRPRQFRQEFLAKLFFANNSGPGTLSTLLAAQRDASRALLDDLQRQIDAVPRDRLYERQVYRLRAVQTEAHLQWLDECEQALLAADAVVANA
ncbi:MAG: PadR family transcriptional regulator [Caldilineales bacterium]